MKFLISLIIIIPTLIAVLLFVVAGLAFNAPGLLAAATNPIIPTLCIIAGVISAIPLIVAIVFLVIDLFSKGKSEKTKPGK